MTKPNIKTKLKDALQTVYKYNEEKGIDGYFLVACNQGEIGIQSITFDGLILHSSTNYIKLLGALEMFMTELKLQLVLQMNQDPEDKPIDLKFTKLH